MCDNSDKHYTRFLRTIVFMKDRKHPEGTHKKLGKEKRALI